MPSFPSTTKHFAAVTVAGLLGAVAQAGAAYAAVANAPPSILVFNQKTDAEISIDYVNIPVDGYVVVYAANADGEPTGSPLGSAEVKAGSHIDLKVTLSAVPKPGTNLWASLYKDKDGKDGFNRQGDKAVWSKLPMQNAFSVQ